MNAIQEKKLYLLPSNIAKLNDIHNQEIYPPEVFDFATIFNNLIDGVIKTITNEDGWQYYKQRKQLYSVLSFNR